MTMPSDIGIIDTMLGFPAKDMKAQYAFITRQTKDRESKQGFQFPAEYMFKHVPDKELKDITDPVDFTLHEMDRWGIERGMIGVHGEIGERAQKEHPDRFIPSLSVDPNRGVEQLREITRAYETWGIKSVQVFPAGTFPQVAINDKLMYPIYAKCCELGIAVFCCAGVPGPRLKFEPQKVEYIDEVMFDFPELVFVTRHGCEPWADLAVKLMLKWPNLYYSTSAFAPRYYPKAIIDYANTRGADKVIFAGYFPMGLSLERIITELHDVPFKDEVWPKFLRGNAERALGIT
jgi:predicted TIM-barrel fold metal-dependent hydrolase